jgi:uncharacterized protein (DUF1015 family)
LPEFFAFAGLRYDCNVAGAALEALAAPPYDVIDEDQRAALESADAHNAVRLLLPRDEQEDGDRYQRAAAVLAAWEREGVLVVDTTPRLYSYRMQFRDLHGDARHTRGVIGALALPEPGDTSVLPHERTMPKARSDRLALLRSTRANVDPIWGLSLSEGLTGALDPDVHLGTCVDADGVVHELGAIDDPARIDEIRTRIGSANLVLADGHHRFETACNYRDELRAAGEPVGGAGAIMMFVVELVDEELDIEPIHRLLDLPVGVSLRYRLSDAFDVIDLGPNTGDSVAGLQARMLADGGLGIVDAEGFAIAVARPELRASALAGEHPAVAATDAAVVEALVAPRLPEASWRFWHDAAAVAALVDKGAATAAILCSPVSVAQTRAAAVAGARMPQKTTFFTPKPRSGLVFRKF